MIVRDLDLSAPDFLEQLDALEADLRRDQASTERFLKRLDKEIKQMKRRPLSGCWWNRGDPA